MGGGPITDRLAQGASTAAKAVSRQFAAPIESADVNQLLADITKLPDGFSPGTTMNGVGTSMGGYVEIPGIPGVGIVRKYCCVLFFPLIPLDLYVVRNWSGSGGVFLGQISTANAAKYVNMKKQSALTFLGGLAVAVVIVGLLCLLALIFGNRR